jgi:hypothetical protein
MLPSSYALAKYCQRGSSSKAAPLILASTEHTQNKYAQRKPVQPS